jgi:hypothetical protein
MKQFITIASCSLLLFVAGCSTERIADYQPVSASINERTAQESGVEVAIDPFVEKSRTEKYFDIDAVANGMAILHVRILNKTTDQTFLVEKKNFQLLPDGAAGGLAGDGNKNEPSKKGDNLSKASLATIAVSAVALSSVGLVIGESLALQGLAAGSKSGEIQRNLIGKEMGDATLSPGKSMEGFVYFMPVKKGEDWTRTAAVKVNLTESKTQQAVQLIVSLSH